MPKPPYTNTQHRRITHSVGLLQIAIDGNKLFTILLTCADQTCDIFLWQITSKPVMKCPEKLSCSGVSRFHVMVIFYPVAYKVDIRYLFIFPQSVMLGWKLDALEEEKEKSLPGRIRIYQHKCSCKAQTLIFSF